MAAPHLRHLPPLMQEIVETDREAAEMLAPIHRPVVGIEYGKAVRYFTLRRAELRARAHEIYGHTPARGDRGPNSAGAVAA